MSNNLNIHIPNTTKHDGRREMIYHLRVRDKKSPADKLEARMLENSLVSKMDSSFERR